MPELLEPLEILPVVEWVRGIYFLIHGAQVVYIGQSENVFVRMTTHAAEGNKVFDRYAVMPVEAHLLSDVEATMILKYLPIYNTSIPCNSLYVSSRGIKHKTGHSKHVVRHAVASAGIKPFARASFGVFYLRSDLLRIFPHLSLKSSCP